MASADANPYDGASMNDSASIQRLRPRQGTRRMALASLPMLLAALSMLVAGCARTPVAPPAEEPAQQAAAPDSAPNPGFGDGSDGPLQTVAVSGVYITQHMPVTQRPRCGEELWVAPLPSGWFSSKPSPDGDIPPPVFRPQESCDSVAARTQASVHYRVVYLFQGEEYSVDLDENPGSSITVDRMGRIVRRTAHP